MHFTYKSIHIHLCNSILVHVRSFPLTLLHFMILCNFCDFVFLMNKYTMKKKMATWGTQIWFGRGVYCQRLKTHTHI